MDPQELRRLAAHYKRVASLVSDKAVTEALLELAAEHEAVADRLCARTPSPSEPQE